jgi:lipopolysaccharide export system permease protein
MKKIYVLVLKSYLGPMVITFFIAVFILLMQFLWLHVDDMVGKGLEWYIIAKLMFYASATFVPLALPLSVLLSSLMTFGNLGEHYELVAMKAAGISLSKVMKPLIVLSIGLSLLTFYFSNFVLPFANLKFRTILYEVRQQKLSLNIKEGVFYNGLDEYVIRVGKKEKDGKTIRNVKIYDHSLRQGNVNLTTAEWGTMELTGDKKYLIFKLYNGCNYLEKTEQRDYSRKRQFQRTSFKEESRRFDLSSFSMTQTNEDLFRSHYSMLNLSQLIDFQDSVTTQLETKKEDIARIALDNYSFLKNIYKAKLLPDTLPALKSPFLSNFTKEESQKITDQALVSARNLKEVLISQAEELDSREKKLYRYQIEIQRKFTLAVACLILFFIGAPLGAIIRKGGFGLPVVFAVIFFVIYHVLSMTSEKFSREGVLPAWQGMWIATLIFLPIGIILTLKATTDAPLMDAEAWKKRIARVTIKKPNSKKQ